MWRVPFSRADGNIGTLMELTVPGALVPRRAAPVLLTSWRTFAEWLRAFDARHLAHPRLRRVLKATSDFVCVALSVTAAIAVADGGVPSVGGGRPAWLIYGIGYALVRVWLSVEVVGFVDDDPLKTGALLAGAPVLGPLSQAFAIAERHHVSEVLVAMPSSDPVVVRDFVRRAEGCGIRVRTVRGVERFVLGQELHRPGSATLHELLGSTDLPGEAQGENGGGRSVLVTGGAGYI